MIRIGLMVIKSLFRMPIWFYNIHRLGKSGDNHTEEERYGYLRMIVKRANKAGRVQINGYGMDKLPKDNGFILFPNHQGLFDMLALIDTCQFPVSVVIKKEAADIILVKQVISLLRGIAIDRSDIKKSFEVINRMTEEVKMGRNFVIFAEGTRSKMQNQIGEFKGGTFKSAVNARCPIIPVALIDSFRPFDISSLKKETVHVHYLEPIYPEQYMGMKTVDIAHLVHDRIQKKIREKTG